MNLSKRILETAYLLLDGLHEKEIAVKLGIAVSTVKRHKQCVFLAFRVRSHVELITKQRDGLITVPGWRTGEEGK